MPRYLRFVRGIIDSNDLPLNVSREILQSNKTIDSMRAGATKRVLGLLEDMAQNDPEKYAKFWDQFGQVMKEGPAEDFSNREQLAKLLRFASTHGDTSEQTVSLADYVGRMKDGQEKIYYIVGDNFTAAKSSPHLEIFRKKGVEVLLLADRVDEWLMSHLSEFDGKNLQSVAKGALDIDMSGHLERLLREAGQNVPSSKPQLEINPDHLLVKQLKNEASESRLSDWSKLLFDQALLAEGGQLDDPAGFVKRLNDMLLTSALSGR